MIHVMRFSALNQTAAEQSTALPWDFQPTAAEGSVVHAGERQTRLAEIRS